MRVVSGVVCCPQLCVAIGTDSHTLSSTVQRKASEGASQAITQVLAALDHVERPGCTVVSILSIALYICHVSKPAKHRKRRSEICALDLQRLRLTVNEYCGAARTTRRPAVAD